MPNDNAGTIEIHRYNRVAVTDKVKANLLNRDIKKNIKVYVDVKIIKYSFIFWIEKKYIILENLITYYSAEIIFQLRLFFFIYIRVLETISWKGINCVPLNIYFVRILLKYYLANNVIASEHVLLSIVLNVTVHPLPTCSYVNKIPMYNACRKQAENM